MGRWLRRPSTRACRSPTHQARRGPRVRGGGTSGRRKRACHLASHRSGDDGPRRAPVSTFEWAMAPGRRKGDEHSHMPSRARCFASARVWRRSDPENFTFRQRSFHEPAPCSARSRVRSPPGPPERSSGMGSPAPRVVLAEARGRSQPFRARARREEAWMRRTHRKALAATFPVLIVSSLLSVAMVSPASGDERLDLSSDAAIVDYLGSIGIDAADAVWQRGLHNYAGPNCPGPGWSCVSANRPVVQITTPLGANQYHCTGPECIAVQSSGDDDGDDDGDNGDDDGDDGDDDGDDGDDGNVATCE